MSKTRWLVLAIPALVLQACSEAPKPAAQGQGPRVYAADVNGGARQCTVPKPTLTAGKVTDVAMTVGNDGGWCGISVALDGKPYGPGLLTQAAQHGTVFIHEVGDATRIDYTPDPHFTGSDSFVVTLLPGDAGVRTSVTVVSPPAQTSH
jgi:hypothetical protein